MDGRSIIKEYYMLAVNEDGYMPAMYREESKAGLVAAGMMELLLHGIIRMEKKKIIVEKELPCDRMYLASLYEYLREKSRSANRMMSDYIASTRNRLRKLTGDIGEALLNEHAVTKTKGGFFGNTVVYIPEKSSREKVICLLKAAVADEGELSPHDMALLSMLKETKNLNKYFSEAEKKTLKMRLKELKRDPGSRQLAQMISYIDDMSAIMTILLVRGMSI